MVEHPKSMSLGGFTIRSGHPVHLKYNLKKQTNYPSANEGGEAAMGGSISDELDSNPDSDDHHLLLNNGSSSIHYGSHR